MSFFARWFVLLIFPVVFLCPTPVGAQSDADRVNTQRYLQVLLRRPRLGVALDRVYGYHVQNDSLDELKSELIGDETVEDIGERQMVWGLIQLTRGRGSDAAEVLTRAEELLPEDAACSFYLGRALLAVGQTEDAAAAMERAIQRGPSRTEALPMFTELGRIYSRAGETEKSLAVWSKLEKLFPGDTKVGGQIARTLADEGNTEEALKRYEQLADSARRPDEKVAFAVQAAEMRRQIGQPDQALTELEGILTRLRPGSWLYSDVRSRIEAGFLKSGDYDALADYYQKQLKDRPDDLTLQTRLSTILVSAGRLTEAKDILEASIRRAPKDIDARLALIDLLIGQNAIDAADKQFEELTKTDPDNPDHLIRWGQVLLDDTNVSLEQRRDGAARVWSRLAEKRSDDAVTLSQIADRMRGIQRSEEAIKLYKKSIEVDPASPQYREYLGEYLYSLDRKTEAIDAWKEIAAGDRKSRESLVRLAEVFGAFEQDAQALETWKEAATLDLNFAEELRYAAKLVEAQQYDKAFERYSIATKIADSPDEREQLLRDRITAYLASGTLDDQIRATQAKPETPSTLRTLALLHGAAGDSANAERAIQKALAAEPDNTDILLVAADIAESQNRLVEAAELFEQLAAADNRFRSNYLQRVANLNVRIGRIDRAMEVCEAIIDANPASPESYQFLARTAFGVQRDEAAIAALRRAMTVAPRDNLPRRMLAGHFADRFRTDEAIELYWQIYRYEAGIENKIGVIASLAQLYDRKSDMDSLISRIEELNRKEGDTRTTSLMIAAAYEAIQDFGAARDAIEPLLATQPRDVALLESMVRLSDAADEVESAVEYQKRINDLADTPENRFRLIQFQLEAGVIDLATALSQRISFVSDPARLGAMVRSAIRRGDLATARALCTEAIKSDNTLWDVKLILAELLLSDQNSEDFEEKRKLALQYAREIRDLNVAFDAKPPSRPAAARTLSTQQPQRPTINQASPMYWSQSSYQIASMMRVGPYGNSYGSASSFTAVEPQSFGHARVIAASLILINEALGKTGDELREALKSTFDSNFRIDDVAKVNDPMQLWEYQGLFSLETMLSGIRMVGPGIVAPGSSAKAQADAKARMEEMIEITWRLAELDTQNGAMQLISMLMSRQRSRYTGAGVPNQPPVEPLNDEQLKRLIEINEANQKNPLTVFATQGVPPGAGKMMLQGILAHELSLAGKAELAETLLPGELEEDADYWTVMSAIQFWLTLKKPERAEKLLPRLLPSAREMQSTSVASQPIPSFDSVEVQAFKEKHQQVFIDSAIALHVQQQAGAPKRSSTFGTGQLRGYVAMGNGSRRSVSLQGPLSSRLLDNQLIQLVTAAAVQPSASSQGAPFAGTPKFELAASVIEALEAPLEDASINEQKTRYVLAAYAKWWSGQPEDCYDSLAKCCELYPSDVDLQIERARLASVLKRPEFALEVLDSFSPLDGKMLVRKELAAMNLAAELGDIERAEVAAKRLFGMRLDVQTQLALADQLRRLGLKERAEAMLRRTRSGRSRDASTQLQIANAFLASGNKEAASEVAYSIFRRLSTGRSQQRNASNYRQQVVSILKNTDRLAPLIERAERRVKSTPKAIRPRLELAELYTAAGRSQDANELWDSLSESKRVSTQQLMTRAEALTQARKFDQAIDLYLEAFEREPQRLSNDIYRLTNTVRQAGDASADKVFKKLLEIPVDSLPPYRLNEIIRMGSRTNFSDVKRKYIGKVLRSNAAANEIYNLSRSIDQNERKKIPEFRDALIRAACSADAFSPTSNLWSVRSRSSGGKANGPLADIIGMLASGNESTELFKKAAENARTDAAQKPSAEFLLALLQTQMSANTESDLKTMRDLVALGAERQDSTAVISSGLLWQAGQILENVDGVTPEFLVELYTESKRCSTSSSSSTRYTVDNRLIKALVAADRKPEAVDRLVAMYESVDNSSQNQHNPGYGDYQDLQSYQWIGDQLIAMGGPVEALIIFKTALGDPERFERAKRWGGSRSYQSNFEQSEKKANEKITPKVAADYLLRRLESWESSFNDDSIVLMEIPLEKLIDQQNPSIFVFLIEKACRADETRDSLEDFADRLDKLSQANSNSWRVAALQWMTAHFREKDVAPAAKLLFGRLPKVETLASEGSKSNSSSKLSALLSLFPVAKLAVDSEREGERAEGIRLARYLETAAGSSLRPAAGLALAALGGDSSSVVDRILGRLREQVDPSRPASEAMVLQCLKFASEALETENYEATAEALMIGLGGGPPLRKITATDPFAVARSVPQPNPTQVQDSLLAIKVKLTSLLEKCGSKLGVSLTTKSPQKELSDFDPDLAAPIMKALTAIAMPENRKGSFFPYAKQIASQQYDTFSNSKQIQVDSVSLAMARLAAASGTTETVFQTLQDRLKTSPERAQVAAAMVQVAFAGKKAELCERALNELESALAKELPKPDAKPSQTNVRSVITSAVMQESIRKSPTIDVVLQAIWPILQADDGEKEKPSIPTEFERAVAAPLVVLMNRTEKLIRSDGYTASRHRVIAQQLTEKMQRWALLSGDDEAIDQYIETTLSPKGNQSSFNRAEYYKGTMQTGLFKLIGEGLLDRLDKSIRKVAELPKDRKEYPKRLEPELCLVLHELDPENRRSLLEQITLGRSGKEPIAYLSGLVRYEVPPDIVRSAQPSLDAVVTLPTCTEDYPIVNTLLMLIDDTVAAGQSDALTMKFSKQLKQPGDRADIALTLIKIAVAERDKTEAEKLTAAIETTITAVASRLKENRPASYDRGIAFPELEALLAFRAARAGVPLEKLEGIIRDVKAYAIRSHRNRMVSAVSRATAKLGIGRTAGGSVDSPLKHFDVVAHPLRLGPDSQVLRPLFSINENGWVSGTSGYGETHLMLKFPITGTFEFSAKIRDGSWGESDVAYGGVIYQAQGWDKTARLSGVGSRGEVSVPVESIEHLGENTESVSVTPLDVQGGCNGKSYVQDIGTSSFPFASIAHQCYRTTHFKEIRLTGSPKIPDQVDLIDPTMRGWGILAQGRNIPKMLLPISPKQDREKIESSRETMEAVLAKGPLEGSWSVVNDELHYRKHRRSNTYDPASQIQYMRPLLDGESITIDYWSEKGKFELSPSLGRFYLNLTDRGAVPLWLPSASDLAAVTRIHKDHVRKESDFIRPEVQPKDDAWNTLVMKRRGDTVSIQLNDELLTEVAIQGHERPGIYRMSQSVRVRSIVLRGENWPAEVPADLMATP